MYNQVRMCTHDTNINEVCCVDRVEIQIEIYKKVGVLPIRIVYSLTFRALALRQRETGYKHVVYSCLWVRVVQTD